MKNRLLPFMIIGILVVAIIAAIVLAAQKPKAIDTVRLNEIKTEVESKTGDYAAINDFGFSIVVIEFDGTVKYSSAKIAERTFEEWLNHAYQNGFVILDFSIGKILVEKPIDNTGAVAAIFVLAAGFVFSGMLLLYWLYIRKNVFEPFELMQKFAGVVAAGNLDSPLLQTRQNAFGAFTESFDILREELKKTKENEARLEKSKRQLVAELSHDIKTPIASIKAVAELLGLSETDTKKQENIQIIRQKASEIDTLITDMFNVTLQDMTELKINIGAVSTADVEKIIKEADYLNKVKDFKLPECLIETDKLRLTQIVGNILNNSYKYAGTAITVNGKVADKMLCIEFRDCGNGIPDEELPLATNKFFRGKNSADKSGAGLGLYICKMILERTGGAIDCFNTEDGFAVTIFLRLY